MAVKELTDQEFYQRALEIYERLRPALEPQRNGEEIAIHVEDGDYEVAPEIAEADRRLRSRHPDAVFFYGQVGGNHAVSWMSLLSTGVLVGTN